RLRWSGAPDGAHAGNFSGHYFVGPPAKSVVFAGCVGRGAPDGAHAVNFSGDYFVGPPSKTGAFAVCVGRGRLTALMPAISGDITSLARRQRAGFLPAALVGGD